MHGPEHQERYNHLLQENAMISNSEQDFQDTWQHAPVLSCHFRWRIKSQAPNGDIKIPISLGNRKYMRNIERF